MSRDIIFLGAGASASDGAPIQNQLFKRYFENGYAPDDEIINFFKDFFGVEVGLNVDTEFPTFEEILGILEISLSREESFKGYSLMPSDPKIQSVREKIIFIIARILKEELQYHRPNHTKLIQRLIKEDKLKKTSFISLNYDILIDNALTDIHDKYDLDYSVNFTNFKNECDCDWHKPRKGRSVKLFKPHGSLNWLYCPTCISLTITPKEKSVSTIADTPVRCLSCATNMIPIIIPPTFFKVMSNHYLQEIWRSMETELSRASNIIFCGYSFPDADVHLKYLIKRVEINTGKTPNIYIVNNHEGKSDDIKKEEERRYKRFFNDANKVKYLGSSFEEFCKNGLS